MDWCDGGLVGPLACLSCSQHKSLASELGQDTGYRVVRTFSVAASGVDEDPLYAYEKVSVAPSSMLVMA